MSHCLGLSHLNNTNEVGSTVGQDFNVTFNSEESKSLKAATEGAKNKILKILGEDYGFHIYLYGPELVDTCNGVVPTTVVRAASNVTALVKDILNLYKTRTCVRPQVGGEFGSGVSIKYFPSPMLVLTGSNEKKSEYLLRTTAPADEGQPCLNYIEIIFLSIALSILILSIYVLFRWVITSESSKMSH